MLKLAIRRVLTERPYRSIPELAFLLNYSERTIRRRLHEMPDVDGTRVQRQILYFLKGAVPARPLAEVSVCVREPKRRGVSGSGEISTMVRHIAASFGCSKQAAGVFLLSYAAWTRKGGDVCAYDRDVGSLLNAADDSVMVRQACAELCRAGLFRADAEDPFTRTGHATGRFVGGRGDGNLDQNQSP